MTKIEQKCKIIRKFCKENSDPEIVKKYARYFKEGYDAYGICREKFEARLKTLLKEWKDELSIDEYLLLGDKLISTGKYEEASFAIRFIVAQKKRLTRDSFNKFDNWLEHGIINWAHTDMLCGELLSFLITSGAKEIESLAGWINSSSIWKRRAVPVTLLDVLKLDIPLERILKVIEPLMEDKEQMVQKGLGWFLREAWKRYPVKVEIFLFKWKDRCGRIIIQYACEKMNKEYRTKFKKTKQ